MLGSADRRLVLLICFHLAVVCVALVLAAKYDRLVEPIGTVYWFSPATFHIFYRPDLVLAAVPGIVLFGLLSWLFATARFSFGYFAGFYFYTMIFGYLWLNSFSDLQYNHVLAGISAVVSLIAFLLPALSISSFPLRQRLSLSVPMFDRMLILILLIGVATIAIGAFYNFRIVGLADIYKFRGQITAPKIVDYVVSIVSTTLLPFAFAGFLARRAYWGAVAIAGILLLFYPITLSKTALFAPIWLVVMFVCSKMFEARAVVVLSLLAPMLAGVVLLLALGTKAAVFFYTVDFRLIAIPALAIDIYNDFFSRHELTHFCQISVLKGLMHCPYQQQLSVVMSDQYGLGNYNASLFATEGIASVGPLWAPAVTFACGLVFALGNRVSAGLPSAFVLISSAILSQVVVNVPLSTSMLSHGMAILLVLWYLTPRLIFSQGGGGHAG